MFLSALFNKTPVIAIPTIEINKNIPHFNNKDKIKENQDEWYQKNKEKILERQKIMITCECGSEIRVSGKAEHNRSDKHKKYMEGLNLH